jgi:regulator of replication initiation timing
MQRRHENLRDTVARQGDELAETRRRSEEVGGRVQQLEEENRLLRESNEGLKGQLARTEAAEQSAVALLQDAIAAGGSKVKEDLGNVRREVTKLKEDMLLTRRMIGNKLFTPSVKKGKDIDVPDGIIAHLAKNCKGNVHDRKIVDVPCGSLEKVTEGATNVAKNAADLETESSFWSAFGKKEEDIPHTRNNWVCHTLK